MDTNEIKELMAQFDASSLREFVYRAEGASLYLSKNKQASKVGQAAPSLAPAAVETAGPSASSSAPITAPERLEQAVPEAEGELIPCPLVGVAYLKPAPAEPDFVSVGDSVKKGQTLLIIEAMKVMNEIPAPRDGVITEILVAAEELIEYGRPLVRLK